MYYQSSQMPASMNIIQLTNFSLNTMRNINTYHYTCHADEASTKKCCLFDVTTQVKSFSFAVSSLGRMTRNKKM